MNHSWQSAKSPGPLAVDVVHVWRVSLVADEKQCASLRQILSPEEMLRAAGFKFEVDRRRFIVAHGSLRLLLSGYLHALPERLVLVTDLLGKPRLADQTDGPIRFNLSRSGEMALYAFAQGHEVGVDVEQIRPNADELAIARRMFTPDEARRLETLQGDERTAAFFNSWTRLEALAKASGRGLSSISHGEFSLPPEAGGAGMGTARDNSGDVAAWQIISLQPGSGYAGAVAAEGTAWKIQCLDWLP
ncbi:MAG TPA: 4'-phosphopantetheinyl transferase superfamily protein [Opitutaceae bacterium]|jgi:4'-phosphopantetheinyl transferase|nr:4'-phosphopantetheinyl transferase superfamily protein [Opitutaceae bacterium]